MAYDAIVVGGGCMGISTVLELQQRSPHARYLLFEGSHETTSSKGLRKIIRACYHDPQYATLATRAQLMWETKYPYCNFYTRTGWVQEVDGAKYKPFHKEEKAIGLDVLSDRMQTLESPRFDREKELWFDESIGAADASLALENVAREAEKWGVERRKEDIAMLVIEDEICKGVQCLDGSQIFASTVVLAAGAWTPEILRRSNVALPPDSFYVTATATATLMLSDDEFKRFKSMPIIVTDQGAQSTLRELLSALVSNMT